MIAGLSVACQWCGAPASVRCDQWRWNHVGARVPRCVGVRRSSHPSRIRAERAAKRERAAARSAAVARAANVFSERWRLTLAWHRAGRPGAVTDFIALGGAS